jgi:hypothetical protein
MTRSEAGKLGAQVSAPRILAAAKKKYYENPSYCKQCGSLIHPKEDSGKAFAEARRKKFCDKSCAAQYNNLHKERKPWSDEAKQRFSELMRLRHPNSKPSGRKKGQATRESSGPCEMCGQTVTYRKLDNKHRGEGYYLYRYYCDSCAKKAKAAKISTHPKIGNGVDFIEDLTKAELREHYNYKCFRAYFPQTARKVYISSGKPLQCQICGYSKAVDVCHKRPVSDFPDDAPVKEINHIDNLTCLCKNHHWELDHNLLDEGVIL